MRKLNSSDKRGTTMMRKYVRLDLRCLSLLRCAACAAALLLGRDLHWATANTAKVSVPPPGVSAYVATGGPKNYIAVMNGNGYSPYLFYGVQIRIDQLLGNYTPGVTSWTGTGAGMDGADYYFNRAQACGFKTVMVPLPWNFIEFTKNDVNSYNFEYLQRIINSANSYGLQVQLLWYGSDCCGYNFAPSYITSNPTAYPDNKKHPQFLDLSNANLYRKESAALVAAMNYVAANDTAHRVVVLQVENEPDGAGPLNGQLQWGNTTNMAGLMFAGGQYAAVNNLINNLAAAVANSNWKGVKRVNIGSSYRSIDCVNYRAGLSAGVDIFGVDLYASDQPTVHNLLAELAPPSLFNQLSPAPQIDPLTSSTSGARAQYTANVTHQPEGDGNLPNLVNLIFSNFADGGGSGIYELRTLQTWQSGGVWQPNYAYGVYANANTQNGGAAVWTDQMSNGTDLTAALTSFNQTIYKADQKIAVATPGTCAAYNLSGTLGTSGQSQTASVGAIPITYQTWSNAPAFAIRDTNGDLILMNLTDGNDWTIDPSFHHGLAASVGYYDASNIWHEQYQRAFNGNTLLAWKQEVMRIVQTP